jgi:hypothetical protein
MWSINAYLNAKLVDTPREHTGLLLLCVKYARKMTYTVVSSRREMEQTFLAQSKAINQASPVSAANHEFNVVRKAT